jgi:hypothetical protein
MTFREKLAHVAKDDPDFARSARNWRIASWVFGIAVVAALGFAGWSLVIGFSNSTKITKIESPCLKYGARSEQCKKAFEQAVLTITHAQACAILRKAGLEIRPCAHARLAQESTRRLQRSAAQGGDASTGSTGTLRSGPREGGSSGPGQDEQQQGGSRGGSNGGGNGRPPAPTPAPSDPQTVPPASPPTSPGRSGDAPGDPEPEPPSPGTVPSTVESAGGAVKEAGEGVGGAVEGVGKSVDCALRGGC